MNTFRREELSDAAESSKKKSSHASKLTKVTKRFGHFTAAVHVSLAVMRLNEPPEPSPGLSEAMPWVGIAQIVQRPEGAREP